MWMGRRKDEEAQMKDKEEKTYPDAVPYDVQAFLDFVSAATSPYHAVMAAGAELSAAGFVELDLGAPWELATDGKYFVKVYDSTLLAFTVGAKGPLRMAAAHTDFPCFRLKPQAMEAEGASCGLVNVEPYGGMIYRTWLDRPLSLAGKVVTRGSDPFRPVTHLVDAHLPLMTIPSLAIHRDRDVNKKGEIEAQRDLQPLFALQPLEPGGTKDWISETFGMPDAPDDLLSYDLMTYPFEQGCTFGAANIFGEDGPAPEAGGLLSSPRLDNMTSVWACVQGLVAAAEAGVPDGVRLVTLFDNEEVGSRTKQGAGSAVLMETLRRIYASALVAGWNSADDAGGANGADGSRAAGERLAAALADGFLLSCDVAHGDHPAYPSKSDPYISTQLGAGVVIKQAASQKYAGDAEAVAIVRSLCEAQDIPYQMFVNRSGAPGGSTLGSIASALVPVRTMDVGVPVLAMHSARETMGTTDEGALVALVRAVLE